MKNRLVFFPTETYREFETKNILKKRISTHPNWHPVPCEKFTRKARYSTSLDSSLSLSDILPSDSQKSSSMVAIESGGESDDENHSNNAAGRVRCGKPHLYLIGCLTEFAHFQLKLFNSWSGDFLDGSVHLNLSSNVQIRCFLRTCPMEAELQKHSLCFLITDGGRRKSSQGSRPPGSQVGQGKFLQNIHPTFWILLENSSI